jgi:DNA-directed RNA polymerase specialized sigma subunit
MPTRPAPKTAFHPLEVLTRRGATQQEVAQTLGISVEEVAKVRRQLRHLNWTIVGATYELVRFDRKNQLQELYTRQVQDAVARKLALPSGDVEV